MRLKERNQEEKPDLQRFLICALKTKPPRAAVAFLWWVLANGSSRYPHQFFPKRLHELIERQTAIWKKEREAAAAAEGKETEEAGKEADKDKEVNLEPLTPEEEEEQKELQAKGFSEWTKRDFNAFLKASGEHGRTSYEEIAKEVEKSIDEVKKYAKVFWARYQEIDGTSNLWKLNSSLS